MSEQQALHPRSLSIFFATEMWERYGFYVVQTLLALFLSLHFKWHDEKVYALVGSFTALTYVSPVVGGWIADHLIGQKRAILAGAVILLFCYLALVFVASYGDAYSTLGLTVSLSGIAVGTGLLKPNISSLLGNEYPEGSKQREHGFTIFYMGITSGIILGSTIPEVLNYHYGWSASFVSAAIGMLISIAIFVFGINHYKIADYAPFGYQLKNVVKALCIIILLWLSSFYILHFPEFASAIFIAIGLLALGYFIYSAMHTPSRIQARHIWVICLLCIISVMFWALYFQMFLSLTLFIARVVKPTLMGIQFPPPYYVSIQSIGAVAFGFFLTRLPSRANSMQRGIHTGNKFVIAMVFMTLGYLIITMVCRFTTADALVSPLLIIPAYLMISLAELFLYPVGLAAVTVLADRNKVSTMMGIFFLSLGLGGFLSGKLADITAVTVPDASIAVLKLHYAHGFNQLFMILIVAVLVCLILNRMIRALLINE